MPAVASRGRGRRTINEINMVPFIDVMLVLLIIFMVTAPLIAPSMINLPSVGKAAKQPDQVVQIIIGKNESLEMKLKDTTTSITLKEVARAVGGDQCRQSRQVRIRGEGHGHPAARWGGPRGLVGATGQLSLLPCTQALTGSNLPHPPHPACCAPWVWRCWRMRCCWLH